MITKLKKNSVKSSEVTFETKKSVPVGDLVDPFAPFKGVDGKTYIIAYDKRLNQSTNCYAFAMGWRYSAKDPYKEYIPGFLTGQKISVENMAELVKSDLEAVGRKVYEIVYDIPDELPDGEGYWIKFLHCPKKGEFDAHFMRKDKKSGRWIHKVGWEMAPKVCVRNLEFKSKEETLMEMLSQKYSRETLESVIHSMVPKSMYSGSVLIKSEIETSDSAGYTAIDENDIIFEYKTIFAMRISEP